MSLHQYKLKSLADKHKALSQPESFVAKVKKVVKRKKNEK